MKNSGYLTKLFTYLQCITLIGTTLAPSQAIANNRSKTPTEISKILELTIRRSHELLRSSATSVRSTHDHTIVAQCLRKHAQINERIAELTQDPALRNRAQEIASKLRARADQHSLT